MGFNPFGAIGDAVRAVGHVAEEGGKALEDGGKAFEGALSKAAKTARSMSLSDLGHTALDVVGMVPVVGSVANLANAGWYAEQGNWAAAAVSAAAAIPLAGDGVDAAKLGDDAVKLGDDAVTAEQATTTATRGARVLDHVAEAGTKVVKAGKAVAPVAAAAPGAITAITDAVHGDWRGAALSAVSAIPLGHLHLPVAVSAAKLGEDAADGERAAGDLAETAKSSDGAENVAKAAARPKWRESETHVAGRTSDQGATEQSSFKGGQAVEKVSSRWPPGSVRPDLHIDGEDLKYLEAKGLSIEVKNYDLGNGLAKVRGIVVKQAKDRVTHLPEGTVQQVVIDVRGQNIPLEKLQKLRDTIVEKSGGVLDPANIRFINNPEAPESLRELVALYDQQFNG